MIDGKLIELIELQYKLERQSLIRDNINESDIMKLFVCTYCSDFVKCTSRKRYCKCKKSSGKYLDKINAVFTGEHCVPLGIDNSQLIKAIKMAEIENKHQKEPTTCRGVNFDSFVILECSTSIKVKKPDQ